MPDIDVTVNSGKYLTYNQLVDISKNTAEYAKSQNGSVFHIHLELLVDKGHTPSYPDINIVEFPVNLEFRWRDRMRTRLILSQNMVVWLDMSIDDFNSLSSKDDYTDAKLEICTCSGSETCHKGRSNPINLSDFDEFYDIIVGGHAENDLNIVGYLQWNMALE
jgi:hypothetical protein|tara:strand:+ start:282 stop:770 length:489 start_codon:yes stop_codon:yes gene_type:complete